MTSEEMHEAFEKHNDEHLKFESIPVNERLHGRPDLCGMLRMDQLCKEEHIDMVSGASHDVIYFVVDDFSKFTDADVIYLLRCGVIWDSETDSLYSFV